MNKQQQWKALDDESAALTKQFASAPKSKQRELFSQLQELVQKRNALGVKQPVRMNRV